MKIYDHNGIEYLDILVDDESYRYRELQGEDYVQLEFALATHVELPLRSYIIIDNVRYYLLAPAKIESEHTRSYAYTARYEAPQAMLKLYRFRNTVDGRQKFPLTAKPIEHMRMLIDNLAPRDAMWQLGDCIDAPEKVISYDYLTCYDALDLIAATFETEWEIVDGAISLHKVEYFRSDPLSLSYGKDKGLLPGVGRSIFGSEKPISAVYPQGGERNIDPSKYGNRTLLLPKSKTIGYDGYYFSDDFLYDASKGIEYATSQDGTSVRRFMPTENVAEGTLDCSDIYPQRVGRVTRVIVRDASQSFYDICDNTIPSTLNYEDYRIAGETMTIVFQSGMLAGKEFSVNHYAHNSVGINESRRFEITPQAYDGVMMPGKEYVPAVGDEYVVFGIALPDAYIADNDTKSGAEWDMLRKCVRYLYENEKPAYSFTSTLDPKFVKRHNIYDRVRVGAYISFTNEGFQPEPMLMRVASVKNFINAPHNIEISINERAFTPTSHRKLIVSNARVNAGLEAALGESRRTEFEIKFIATDAQNTALKVASDREIYKLEHKTVLAERETIGGEFADFLAYYEQLYTADDEICIDADGKALYVRGENELWDRYIAAYNAYDNELQAAIQSTGVVEQSEAYTASQLEYYTAKVALLKAISTEQKAQISDLDYLKQAFGADNVVDSDGVTLSRMMSVKDANANVVAGMYGGGVENLDSIGYDDPEHGTMMIFAGATSAQTARNAKYRVYEDGTTYIKEGIFEGVIKHRVVDITKTNITSILPPTETTIDGYTSCRISPMLMSAIMNITNEIVTIGNSKFTASDSITFAMPVLYGFTLYDTDSIVNTSELRGLVGTRFIVYNNTPALVHFCGKRYNPIDKSFSDVDTCHKDWIVGEGQFATAECKLELDGSSREVIYWDIKVGNHERNVLPADEE